MSAPWAASALAESNRTVVPSSGIISRRLSIKASLILSADSSGRIFEVVNDERFSLQINRNCLCGLQISAENFDPKDPLGDDDWHSISFGGVERLTQIGQFD